MSISFDYFSLSLLIGGFVALLSGLVVYIHNHKTIENVSWFFFNLTSAVWSFGYFATINAPNKGFAFVSDWILHLAAILVPLFCLLSVISITKNYEKHKVAMVFFSILGLFFMISTPTRMFVRDVIPKAGFDYVPDAGPLYIYFTLYFFALVFYVLSILFKTYLNSKDPIESRRLKYMFIFTAIGSVGGGSVFFLTFNIPFLPYPLILFSLFPVISIYAIFRLELFNVKVVTTEAIVFFLWIFVLIRTLISTNLNDFIINGILLLLMNLVGVFLIRSVIKEVKLREELDVSNTRLKNANQGQVNLIHLMNHQIKGRFGTAKNIFAELLTDDYGNMPEESRFMLQKGLEETNLGIQYVQSILKGASAENGSLPLEMKTLDFKKIVEDTYNDQKDKAEKKELKISLSVADGEFNVNGDELQLSEAVRNLMDNSINYTLEGSIDVSLSVVGNRVRLQVKDSGVGLTDDDKSKLFKSGGRGSESLKVNVNSTGYGLAFVKGVIEAHSGYVWAESEGRGKGSTFILELPKI
ncbi:MAG: ATP-binding protein [Parcubacteria group bacterium]